MNLLDRAKHIANGIATLTEWLGSGAVTVDPDMAQRRADTCLKCPKHTTTFVPTEAGAAVIKRQLELKKHLQLRVQGEKSLHTCDVCGCAMRLKIWLPITEIKPQPDERNQFPPNCWLLTETP